VQAAALGSLGAPDGGSLDVHLELELPPHRVEPPPVPGAPADAQLPV
jgi:hypothetical protein